MRLKISKVKQTKEGFIKETIGVLRDFRISNSAEIA